jgi:putative DNA primase/helicase
MRGRDVAPVVYNLQMIMRHDPALNELFYRDEFAACDMMCGPVPTCDDSLSEAPGPYPREIADPDVIQLLAYLQARWSPEFTLGVVEQCLPLAARERRVHPVRDGLARLQWDGEPRLDNWLTKVFGCDDTPYVRAVASKFLIAAVRRVRQPGCKFDFVPVLSGPQGVGKSTAISTLFDPWSSDSLAGDLGHKDAAIGLQGVWCVELAEIHSLIRSETETTKSFLSRRVDRFRPPYGKRDVAVPRQSVLIGTTNSQC